MTFANALKIKLQPNSAEPVRAVIYARVSTENDNQKDSCANQVNLAQKYVVDHPNITLVDTYIDDGISGKNDFTRPEYNNMLQRLSDNGFDLIITKSLSRLNRDELNSLVLNAMLVDHNATILTLEDGQIHDFEDINSGLLHSIKYAIDAQYVKQQSINGRKTQELRCLNKTLTAKDCAYGYDWNRDTKTITINTAQADVVMRIFEDYVYKSATPANIQRSLKTDGVNMCARTVTNIILDERYIGHFYINKRTTKLGTGRTKSKRIALPKDQWILVDRPDLQIIDNELFALAQREHASRITLYDAPPDAQVVQARFQGYHTFASKVFCTECGKSYTFGYADRAKTVPVYRIKFHGDCKSPNTRITEMDLEIITRQAIKAVMIAEDDIYNSVETLLIECLKLSQQSGNTDNLTRRVKTLENQLDRLIDTLAADDLTQSAKSRIKDKINRITADIDSLSVKIMDINKSKLNDTYVTNKIADIKKAIIELKNFTTIDRAKILNYIHRIEIDGNGNVNVVFKSGHIIRNVANVGNGINGNDDVGKSGKQDAPYSAPEACQSLPPSAPPRQ